MAGLEVTMTSYSAVAAREVIFSAHSPWLKPASITFSEAPGDSFTARSAPATICSYSGLPATTPGTKIPTL